MVRLTFLKDDSDLATVTIANGVSPMVGREVSSNEIALHDPKVSRIHARIVCRSTEVLLQDLKSTMGSFVNGVRVEGTRSLCDGDRLEFGDTAIRINISPWVYHESAPQTLNIQRCPNPACRLMLDPVFRFCPHCGDSLGSK